MREKIVRVGCWLLVGGVFVAGGAGLWLVAEAFNFTGAAHPGRDAVSIAFEGFAAAGLLIAFRAYQRRTTHLVPKR